MAYEKELAVGTKLAKEAGAIMLRHFNTNLSVTQKEDESPVTAVDTEINGLVIKRLEKEFPDDGVVGEEESTAEMGDGRRWFCDPVDGTKGYILGIPTAMFSLALIIDGAPVLGIAYDPFLDRLFAANAGGPATCNNDEIHVSDQPLNGGYVAASSAVNHFLERPSTQVRLAELGANQVAVGGAVNKGCGVARGAFVGYVDDRMHPHDIAAIHVIVESAGGTVTGMDGEPLDYRAPFTGGILSNGRVHSDFLRATKG